MKSHSLLELSQSIERVISHTFNATYWVRAEISRLNYYPKSGHCYPELVEKQNGKIVAEIRSTIWRGNYQTIASKFKSQTGEELKEGMNILFLVSVNFSPAYGISLNISDIDPSFTMGEMAKEKKNTIDTLVKARVFDQNKSVPFPFFPNRLAIISVSTSKGYHDFLETMHHKALRFNINTTLFPAILQGDTAVKSITEQLELISERKDEFDVVLIIRGGGGDVGLHCYNHLDMAKTVATFPLPVITGIGHSTNQTVVEMVANTNKITPTAVADVLAERFIELENNLKYAHQMVSNVAQFKIEPQRQRLLQVIRYLKSSSAEPLHQEKLKIQRVISKLSTSATAYLSEAQIALSYKLTNQLKYASQNSLKSANNKIDSLASKVKILDPKNVLKRGFSMTHINGKAVTKLEGIAKGETITTTLFDGIIESKIIKTITHE